MFSSGLMMAQTATMDSLVTLLTDSDKTKEAVKTLKAEQNKLTKLKKDVLSGNTLLAFKRKIETEIADEKKEAEQESKKLAEARQNSLDELKKATTAAKRASSVLHNKEKADKLREARLTEYENNLLDKEKSLIAREVQLKEGLAYSKSLKKEYTDKLLDLKERMRGL